MKIRTSIVIVFAVLIVIFTLQNTEVVSVKLWFWEVNTSRALLIIASIAIGIFFGMLLPPLRRKCDEDYKKDNMSKPHSNTENSSE
ncbi:MAG: LapA family protein [Marinilabiliaceae bacterium]|jgi:uncharacterized integral membrane protein|nr:LapA family protein [Marinilabiliaceae bacterium]